MLSVGHRHGICLVANIKNNRVRSMLETVIIAQNFPSVRVDLKLQLNACEDLLLLLVVAVFTCCLFDVLSQPVAIMAAIVTVSARHWRSTKHSVFAIVY